jgi:hypothetical protein
MGTLAEDFCDLVSLIRSLQRQEGQPDCFGTGRVSCEHPRCLWREYCLTSDGAPALSKTEKRREGISWKKGQSA